MILSRRRFLAIAAVVGAGLFAARPEVRFQWSGTALGAEARIVLAGLPRSQAERALRLVLAETERLERIFSLYRPESELSRLNRDGTLSRPSHDFHLLLDLSLHVWRATGGAFNPAIQPVWRFLAAHFAGQPHSPPDAATLKQNLALADPGAILAKPNRIALRPGMALTFNGIAQGYITDAAARLLEAEGFRDILIDLGELRALPGRAWEVGIEGSSERLALRDRAIAQSAGRGTPFTADLRWHHLIDPATGESARTFAAVTVSGACAGEADALSTALYVAPPERHAAILRAFPGCRLLRRERP